MDVNFGFLDQSRYFQVAPQLSSWDWVDPGPDPLLLRKSGSTENRTQELWPLDHRGSHIYIYIYMVYSRAVTILSLSFLQTTATSFKIMAYKHFLISWFTCDIASLNNLWTNHQFKFVNKLLNHCCGRWTEEYVCIKTNICTSGTSVTYWHQMVKKQPCSIRSG
jgi:hypothetical protein